MSQLTRTQDVVVLFRGDAYTVMVDPTMRTNGWHGGQGVQWLDSNLDEFLTTYSDGLYGGFMLWGSNEPSDQFVSTQEQQPQYGYGVLCLGGWLIMTRTFERYTYASRVGGGPLVPLTYQVGQRILFSLRGYFTVEDEWSAAGDPRAPNGYYVGSVVQAPTQNNQGEYYVTLQTSI
jgi:hypothetical protein